MTPIIRLALKKDAPHIARLSGELGYDISVEETIENLTIIERSLSEIIFVAILDDEIVGWIQVSQFTRLEKGTFCEITGLVTDERYRGNGIGRELVNAAIDWSRNHDSITMYVRSNIVRKDSHLFYERLGFTTSKQQKVFNIDLRI